LARALGVDAKEVWRQALIDGLERWLKKEGFRGIRSEVISNFFEALKSKP
jgi:hypothetical protein